MEENFFYENLGDFLLASHLTPITKNILKNKLTNAKDWLFWLNFYALLSS